MSIDQIRAAIREYGARRVHDAAIAHMEGTGSLHAVGLTPGTLGDCYRALRAATEALSAEEQEYTAWLARERLSRIE